jgi:hypothetical protein
MVLFLDDLFKAIGEYCQDFTEPFNFLLHAFRSNGIDRYDYFGAFK